MKHKIVEVKNMIKTEQLLDNLLNRSSIVPGIGLIHGPSGFGKTTAVEWLFNQDEVNGIYVRCYKADTVTSLLEQIAKEIGIPQRHNLRAQVDGIVEAVRRRSWPSSWMRRITWSAMPASWRPCAISTTPPNSR